MSVGLTVMKNVLTPLAKSVLVPLDLTAVALETDTAIQAKVFSSRTTALIISEEKMKYIMKIVKSREESGLLIKDVSETIKNETKD